MFKLRPYQQACVDDIRGYIESREIKPGLVVAPVGSGKSILLAEAARLFGDKTLVIQPSKELLEQNISKLRSLGGEATIYSASCKSKELSSMTYATLGSVKKVVKELREMGVRHVLIDETHAGYSPEPDSEFMRFINELRPSKVIGFTATPCRLTSHSLAQQSFSQLNFLTRMRPVYFKKVIHVTQVSEMVERGFWTPIEYETWEFRDDDLVINSNGSEYTEESIKQATQRNGVNNLILKRLQRLDGYKSILVFMDSVENCQIASEWLNKRMGGGVSAAIHGGLSKKERERIVEGFKSGDIRIVFNHSVLLTGFDHPGLDCVIIGRPTFSFPVFYQSIGRAVRIKPGKEKALVIDCCGNVARFGDVRKLSIREVPDFGWAMVSGDRIISNVPMEEEVTIENFQEFKMESRKPMQERRLPGRPKEDLGKKMMGFGKYMGYRLWSIPTGYYRFLKDKNFDLRRYPEVEEYMRAIKL